MSAAKRKAPAKKRTAALRGKVSAGLKAADPAARSALALHKDGIFKLLVVMIALLGWIAGMGGGAMVSLQNVYSAWQLQHKTHISIYLMPDSSPQQVQQLENTLIAMDGVKTLNMLDQDATRALVAPYVGDTPLPLPKIMDAEVSPALNRAAFTKAVTDAFPQAEVDDGRDMLTAVSHGVRFVQVAATAVALCVLIIMTLLVALTVRAGLRGKTFTLRVMQLVGATDDFLVHLVRRQVALQAVAGGAGSVGLGLLTLLLLKLFYPTAMAYTSLGVWLVVVLLPLFLVAVVLGVAHMVATRTLAADAT